MTENPQAAIDAVLVNVFAAAAMASGNVKASGTLDPELIKSQIVKQSFDIAEAMLSESKRRGYADFAEIDRKVTGGIRS